jgi:hypothetical protein
MLDRVGDEVARATSIVRYAPGSLFSSHTHDGGEEFLVLDGVFQDEHGDYPAGTYVRNPPGTRHTPGAAQGCTLFVKLWQFDPADDLQVRVDTRSIDWQPMPGTAGASQIPLFVQAREHVRLERWAPEAVVRANATGGMEILVLSGGFQADDEMLEQHAWLRLPPGAAFEARCAAQGCVVWIKTGHLESPVRLPTSGRAA